MKHQQTGFTLVELIVVIVILGILAATALPRFVNLQGDARVAAIQGIGGAMNSARDLVQGKWLAAGDTTAVQVLLGDGNPVAVNTTPPEIAGMPTAAATGMGAAITVPTTVVCAVVAGDFVCTHSAIAGCTATYVGASGAVTTATTAAACGGN